MSKAFTKEGDGADSQDHELDDKIDEELENGAALPQGFKNYMTSFGHKKLQEELKNLLYTARPEMVKTVSWAASNGDRSENGDYIYGKRKLREIDRRIRFLTKRLETAVVVVYDDKASTAHFNKVQFGARVKLRYEEGQEKSYQIVGIDEADVSQLKISWISPLAKALLQHSLGDVVVFRSPKGEEEIEIISVDYSVVALAE
jgi:transcription elongation factor GreB